jgi:hypothetical protein
MLFIFIPTQSGLVVILIPTQSGFSKRKSADCQCKNIVIYAHPEWTNEKREEENDYNVVRKVSPMHKYYKYCNTVVGCVLLSSFIVLFDLSRK